MGVEDMANASNRVTEVESTKRSNERVMATIVTAATAVVVIVLALAAVTTIVVETWRHVIH